MTSAYPSALWHKVLAAHPEANFLQSPAWFKYNQTLGHQVLLHDFGSGHIALSIVKNARRGRYLEIPAGPLIDWQDQRVVSAAFAELKATAHKHHCVFIRFRPALRATPANFEIMKSLSARPAPFHLHAERTVVLDLTASTDDLLAAFRRQTRYEVRRATKLALKVSSAHNAELLHHFHEVQAATARRQHFIPPSAKELESLSLAFKGDLKIYRATDTNDQTVALGLVLTAPPEAVYFEAASTDLNRQLPGAYALQWQIIKDLKKQGITRYNLWGIAPKNQPGHRYAGVTTFKTGFGGEIVDFVPAHDLVLRPLSYLKTLTIETIRKKRRHL